MSDREEMYDLMVRYGRANDTNDVALFRTCFTEDIVFEAAFSGGVEGLDALADHWLPRVVPFSSTHQFTNFTFDLDGDAGSMSCLLLAQHWPAGTDATDRDTPTYTVGGRYDVTLRRTPDGWRAAHFRLTPLWTTGDAAVLAHLGAGAGAADDA